MSLSGRDKTILIVLAVLLAIVLYVELFLMPIIGKISDKNTDINYINSRLQSMNVTPAKYNENKQKKEDLDNQVEAKSEALPSIPKEPEITYDLFKQASSAGVGISSVSFSGSVEFDPNSITKPGETSKIKKIDTSQGKLMSMPAAVMCSGSYNAILNFINNIETGTRIAEVQNVSMGSSGDSDLLVSMNIYYYYLDNPNIIFNYKFVKNPSTYGKSNMFSK